jgi:GNAT superfamily N-acetyltransferase
VQEGRTRAASIDGQIVGFASVAHAADRLALEDLFVDPAFMRQGVGRALVGDVAEQARQHGLDRVDVDANDHAAAYYEQVGFIALGRVALEHGTAVRMTLTVGGQARLLPGRHPHAAGGTAGRHADRDHC